MVVSLIKKKFLAFLIFLISSLFFINNVKALNDTITIDYDSQRLSLLQEKKDIIQHVVDIAEQYNTHNFSYIISTNITSSNVYLSVGVVQGICSEIKFNPYIMSGSSTPYQYVSSYQINESYCSNPYYDNKYYSNYTYIDLNNYDNSSLNSFYNNIQSFFTSKINGNYGLYKSAYANLNSKTINLFDYNNVSIGVYSNTIMKYYKNKSYAYDMDLIIDNQRYVYNDIVPTYMDLRGNVTPEISFTTQNYTINNQIYKIDLTIDYGYIDNNNYYYLYSLDNGNSWVTNILNNTTSYTLPITKNCNVIARVVDINTMEPIDTKTYVFDNIETNFDVSFTSEELKDEYNNIYQTNIDINYSSLNRTIYDYEYRTDNFILDNNEFWVTLDNDKTNQLVNLRDNINIYTRIKDKDNGNILYSETFVEDRIRTIPKISFKEFKNIEYSQETCNDFVLPLYCGKNYVKSVDLTIDFAIVDNDKYLYMYKDNLYGNGWVTNVLDNRSIDVNFTNNTDIIVQVVDKNTNEVITSNTYNINSINNIVGENGTDITFNNSFEYINQNNNLNDVFSPIKTIWNSFNRGKIHTYLMIVIVTSIIILILKGMNK